MIILSNDYIANLPGSKRKAQGGPKIFARIFSQYATTHGCTWVGVVMYPDKKKGVEGCREVFKTKNRTYIEVRYSAAILPRILKIKSRKNLSNIIKPAIENISKIVREINPDIVFLNGYSLENWMLMKAAHATRIPIVMQHAGIWKKEIQIHSHLYTSKARKIFYKMERDISRYVNHEIFLSKYSLKVYNNEVAKINKKKVSIIPLPYSRTIRQKKKRIKKDQYAIGMVARWDRIKNHEAVLRLAKKAKEKGLPWTFYSVTSIPKTLKRKEFKKAYTSFIRIEKQMERRALVRFFQKMDIMILPSHFDVSPFVVIEAAMEETPTLISPNVGHGDEYKAAGAGEWIIDFSSEEKVVRRIKKIINKPIPDTLIRSFKKLHNPEKVCKQYLALFKKITKKK